MLKMEWGHWHGDELVWEPDEGADLDLEEFVRDNADAELVSAVQRLEEGIVDAIVLGGGAAALCRLSVVLP
jgi:hypothetical protein